MREFLKLIILRGKILKNLIIHYKGSYFKVFVITIFSISFLLGLFFLFKEGFQFLKTIPLISEIVINRLFYFLFLFTFFLMIFSSILTSYTTFFSKGETDLFFSLPIDFHVIFSHKFIESAFYTSWAFIFVGIPFLSAYGITNHLHLNFYLIVFFLVIPFILLSSGLGSLFTLILSRVMALKGWRIYILALSSFSIPFLYFLYKLFSLPPLPSDLLGLVKGVFLHFRLSQHSYLPSYWIANGISLFMKGKIIGMFKYSLLLYIFSFLLIAFLVFLSEYLYFPAFSNAQGSIREKKFSRKFSVLNLLSYVFHFLPRRYRALVVKDLKTFFRDPSQWSQFLIFFGILGIYIINLRHYHYFLVTTGYKMMISLVNISAMGFILSTLSARFIFPQISLEGRRIWIVKMSYISMREILWEKFLTAFFLNFTIVAFLSNLTFYLLKMHFQMYIAGNILIFCIALSSTSLSVGLGSIFPDFSSDNPAKIVSGFGGTLNFILNILYILFVVSLVSSLFYLTFIVKEIDINSFNTLLKIALILILGITFPSVYFPMVYATKKLEKLEI